MGGGGAVIAQLVKASDSDWLPSNESHGIL